MKTLTREQRVALKRIYDRGPLVLDHETKMFRTPLQGDGYYLGLYPVSYREFRKLVQTFPCDSAVAVPWCGMWLGVEPDGYTHS